jgi:hypothetical protein
MASGAAGVPLPPALGPAGPAPGLVPGSRVEIVKLDPAGAEVVRYPGVVLSVDPVTGWVATEARWVNRDVVVGGLPFRTGARLVEWFSAAHPYNCFAVHDPDDGRLLGWYANVTWPARFDLAADPPTVTWPDLWLDVIGMATDGDVPAIHDEDELAASGLAASDPALHDAIVATAHAVVRAMRDRHPPFGTDGEVNRPNFPPAT